jgi:hypothetical protein
MKPKKYDVVYLNLGDTETPRQLPIYKLRGKFYFRDARLQEYRNVHNIDDAIPFDQVTLDDLEKVR